MFVTVIFKLAFWLAGSCDEFLLVYELQIQIWWNYESLLLKE